MTTEQGVKIHVVCLCHGVQNDDENDASNEEVLYDVSKLLFCVVLMIGTERLN